MNLLDQKRLIVLWTVLVILLFLTPRLRAQNYSTSISQKNGKSVIKVDNGSTSFRIEYEGEFTLSDDDRDITGISRGGYFELSKSAFGARRRVRIESSGGRLVKQYFVGPAERNFEPEGREWLAEVLLEVVRGTTIGAESRVNRIYAKGGANAVLTEVRNLGGDYTRSTYMTLLLQKELTGKEQHSLLLLAGELVDSDFHLAEILQDFHRRFQLDDATAEAFLSAAAGIDSDFHKAEILKDIVRNPEISGARLAQLIEGANDIESDFHKSEILKEVIRKDDLTDRQVGAIIRSASHIDSDFHQAEVLRILLDNRPVSSENLSLVIEAARDIDSDLHKSEVYSRVLKGDKLSASDVKKVLSGVESIDSDLHLSQVLEKLLDGKLDQEALTAVMETAGVMESDHHRSVVLKKALKHQKLTAESMDAFVAALEEMSSDHFMAEIIKSGSSLSYSETDLVRLIKACGKVDSDFYRSESLVALSRNVNNSGENAKKAYREVARGIDSEIHYGQAIRALDY